MTINDINISGRALYEYGVATLAGIGLGGALFFVMLTLPEVYRAANSMAVAA